MNIGRVRLARYADTIGFTIDHEDLRREALLTDREARALIAELERMLAAKPSAPTPATETSVFD